MTKRTAVKIGSNGVVIMRAVIMLLILLVAFSSSVMAVGWSLVSANMRQTENRNYWALNQWECGDMVGTCQPMMCEIYINMGRNQQYELTGKNGSNYNFTFCSSEAGTSMYKAYERIGFPTTGCNICTESHPINYVPPCSNVSFSSLILRAGTYRRAVLPYGASMLTYLLYDDCGLPTPDQNTPTGYLTTIGDSSFTIKLDCAPEESEKMISHIHIETNQMELSGETPPSGNELLINGTAPSYVQQAYNGYYEHERYYYWGGFLKWDIPLQQQCGSTVTLKPTSSLYAYAPLASITGVLSEDKEAGEPDCKDAQGNPVNATNGNKYESTLDLSVSTPGVPLEFKRYYNSFMLTDGPLGIGWTHSYSMSTKVVRISPTMRIKIINADGKALYFQEIPQSYSDGIHFYGESGVKDRLVKNAAGQYILRKKDNHFTYTFDTDANNGRLLSIADLNGNTLSLTYTDSLLTNVTNNFGKSITISYDRDLPPLIVPPS